MLFFEKVSIFDEYRYLKNHIKVSIKKIICVSQNIIKEEKPIEDKKEKLFEKESKHNNKFTKKSRKFLLKKEVSE